jgi:hypothetical protein
MNKTLIGKIGILGMVLALVLVTPGCGVCGFGPGQVLIRDPQLELALRQALNVPFSCITRADMLRLTQLSATSYGIRYLDGLEFATNLVSLDLDSNYIEDIAPLRDLDKLVNLNLAFNGIDYIEPISSLDSLRNLNLACNGTINDWNPLAAVVTTNNGFLEGGIISVDEDSVLVQNSASNEDEFTFNFAFVYDAILQYQIENGVVIEVFIGTLADGSTGTCGF